MTYEERIAIIRRGVEALERCNGFDTHAWMVAKCYVELRAADDLRFLLDYIDRNQVGGVSRDGQFLLGLDV